jgi:hypothetical protein
MKGNELSNRLFLLKPLQIGSLENGLPVAIVGDLEVHSAPKYKLQSVCCAYSFKKLSSKFEQVCHILTDLNG